MIDLIDRAADHGCVRVVATERSDGDIHPTRVAPADLAARQTALTGRRWSMARQTHGVEVWRPDDDAGLGPEADVVVIDRSSSAAGDSAVAMWAADCATLLLIGPNRLVGVHAGWRGLAAGVIDRAVDAATDGGGVVAAVAAGPVIGPCCYPFGPEDLEAVAAGVHARVETIRATSTTGEPALDVAAATRTALAPHGLGIDVRAPGCTGCDDRWFSHRTRVDTGRHALVGWWT